MHKTCRALVEVKPKVREVLTKYLRSKYFDKIPGHCGIPHIPE
jgi:hypothetical protein